MRKYKNYFNKVQKKCEQTANKVQIKYRFLQYSNFSSVNQADKNTDK